MTRMSRTAPLLGLVGVVLLNVGNEVGKIGGGSPDLHASGEDYVAAVGGFGTGVLGAVVVVVGLMALAGFFAALAECLRGTPAGDRAARVVTAGGFLAAAFGIAGAPPVLAASVMAADGDLEPAAAKALLLMNAAGFVLLWLVVAVPLAAFALVGMRAGILGRGLGWSGLAVAGLLAAGSLAVWWVNGLVLAWLLAMVWMAVVSVVLTVRVRRSPLAVESAAPAAVRVA